MKRSPVLFCVAVFAGLALSLKAVAVSVPATADIWLAGQPNGTTASLQDVAPDQSPVLGGSFTPGWTVWWSASGSANNGPGITMEDPNGGPQYSHASGAENGIADLQNVPINSLIGVFIGAGVPGGPAPAALNFAVTPLNYGTLSPLLFQPFFMGDGSAQSVVVPVGATRLFLGTMDGYGWWNNEGGFEVNLWATPPRTAGVPEGGSTAVMLVMAAVLLAGAHRRR